MTRRFDPDCSRRINRAIKGAIPGLIAEMETAIKEAEKFVKALKTKG